ncbi:MAG: prolipoprotein diacylglyceryl transferase [Gammaproteobacteria bacterium]|nr:prolipoprotein diacylglyceryl transferase [Gammaproteobacteria bacterium]
MFEPFIHNIDPVIGQIGGMYLWWYGLGYSLGFLGLFSWLRSVRYPLGVDVPQVYDLSILMASGVLIGGRAVEVIFYEWPYYSDHPGYIPWVWLGGMSTHGILFGGTLGAWIFCRLYKKSFLSLADELVIPAAFIMGLGRIGNFIDGQIVGSLTDVWWAVKFPDAEGFRHPVVLYDGLKNLLLIPVLLFIRTKKLPYGVLLGAFLFGYGFFRILIDFFREYRVELYGLPPGQEFNIGMCVIGIGLIILMIKRGCPRADPGITTESGNVKSEKGKLIYTRRLSFGLLLIIPLVIPSDWTQDVPARYGKRHDGMIYNQLYPEIKSNSNNENN